MAEIKHGTVTQEGAFVGPGLTAPELPKPTPVYFYNTLIDS